MGRDRKQDELIGLFRVRMNPIAAFNVKMVLDSGYIGEGRKVISFEREFWRYTELSHAPVMVNSGTSALVLALDLLGVGSGDEVVTTPMTCVATNAELLRRGCKIVWADVDAFSGLAVAQDIAKKVTAQTKCVIVVNWGGRPYRCRYLMGLISARNLGRNIPIIEDAAHGPYHGNQGDFVAWSFQAIKFLTTGDGGALYTPKEYDERARRLRWFGLDRHDEAGFRCKQDIKEMGTKMQMNDIAASIGLANLEGLTEALTITRENARLYTHAIRPCDQVMPPHWDAMCSWWLYTVLVDDRDAFISFLEAEGVEASQVHARNDELSTFRKFKAQLPGLDSFSRHNVAIPVGHWLSEPELNKVLGAVNAYSKERMDA